MKTRPIITSSLSALTLAMLPGMVIAQSSTGKAAEPQKVYSPYVERTQSDANFAEGVYFGDTHVHTSYSADAGMIGNTVDEANASYLNNVGDAELRAAWTDPDFDPKLPAVYYVRVLEIPTPTSQACDSKFFGITMPKDVPMSHQERACTSPIWYGPQWT